MDWLEQAIGRTPLIELKKLEPKSNARIFAKAEFLNLSGSVKDRMACYMLKQAEKKGLIRPGGRILEATSGNTGIAFATLSALKGYKFTAVMPEFVSKERIQIIKALGGEVVLTPAKEDMAGAVKKFEQLAKKYKSDLRCVHGSAACRAENKSEASMWTPRQFENPDNPKAHAETANEILGELKKIDAFVAGVGTGGTLMGVGKTLKAKNPKTKIVAVEPDESAVLSGKKPGLHQIYGIGEGFVPKIVNKNMIDKVIRIKSSDAIDMARRLAKEEGLLVGVSSGANVLACLKLAKEMPGASIVTILPDRGEHYLSLGIL